MEQPYLIEPIKSSTPKVKEERTFWRDMKLLQRHRDWEFNVPAVDIDFLEYDHSKAVALVEYKRRINLEKAEPYLDANIEALIDLGNRAGIPVFCVFYTPNLKRFRAFGLNDRGKGYGPPEEAISEYKYVDFLYYIRGRTMPKNVGEKLWQ